MDRYKNKEVLFTLFAAALFLVVMTAVERYLKPGYLIKSVIKFLLISSLILLHGRLFHKRYTALIGLKKKKLSGRLLFFALFAYGVIIFAFFLFKDRIDLTSIREALLEKEGLNRDNFIFIFSYIIIVNSFLEESFFRGYLFQVLRGYWSDLWAAVFSAVVFSVYHISIVSGWFDILVFLVMVSGLSAAGLFLQYVSYKQDTLLGSWLVHACANLAINTIGTIMLLG